MTAEERWVGVDDVAAHLDVNKDSIRVFLRIRLAVSFVSNCLKSMTGFVPVARLKQLPTAQAAMAIKETGNGTEEVSTLQLTLVQL